MPVHSCELGSDAAAVPVGRRFTSAALRADFPAEVVDAAEVVVTELLTNALFHGAPPIHLVVRFPDDGGTTRIEIHDGSPAMPVRPRPGEEGMTGRGLALVDALSADWGVTRTGAGGKAVWAELNDDSVRVAEPGETAHDALLLAFSDDEELGQERFTVTLGDVPTELLLSAKAHVDSVVRELTLAATGAESGVTGAIPAWLAQLVHDVVTEFAEARQAIKRQALAAAGSGEDRTSLRLTLPADAAAAGERYLTALEEADAYARASRMLTVAAPPQHAAFRRWYVTSLVDGLRRASAGEQAVVAPSFETYLLAEVDHLAELQEVSDRAARLQRVTAALAVVLDRDEVARIALEDAVSELAASRGVVLLVVSRGVRPGATIGYPPEQTRSLTAAWEQGTATPGHVAFDTGRPVWVESREECVTRYPEFARLEPSAGATCAVPLVVAGHLVGVLRLTFDEGRLFNADERAFLTALAAVAAQALERADLYDARGSLAERLVRLQEVTAALAVTRTVDEVLDVAIEHATGLVGARVASISLLAEDGHTIELHRMRPELPSDRRWWTFDLADELPASEAIRTGELLWTRTLQERDERWPAVAVTVREFDHSFAAIPLHAEGITLGALTLSFAAEDMVEEPSREFLTAFAGVCAQAVQRARAAETAAAAHRRLAFLARASEELSGTLDIETTLGNLARLTVPEVADLCVIHLLQDDELACVAVEHVDPAKRELAVTLQQRFPERLEGPGIGRVVRTGQPLLVPSVEAARAPGRPQDQERQELLEQIGSRSAVVAPLIARGRTLGALSFLSGESERVYGEADLPFVDDLARRAAVAVDNARLYGVAAGPLAGSRPSRSRLVQRPRVSSLPGHADDAQLRWSLAQEAGRLGSWDFDAATATLRWDEQCAGLFGTSVGEHDSEFEAFQSRLHPDDVERVLDVLRSTIATGTPFDLEYRARLPDGRVRHLLSRGQAVVGPDGHVDRVVGAVVDVTELREAASAESRAAQAARRLSETLQRSLLTRPPEPDHLEVAVRYVPASQEAQVGGDWYDAFLTRDGSMNLVIGDCTGHDREAVAAMAAVRNLLRATAYALDGAPAAVLTALEQTMAGLDVGALATAVLARVEQAAAHRERGVRSMVWSNAGHLPPLLREASGRTVVLHSAPDLMLGLMPTTDRSDHQVDLPSGATVLLYTDGLVERRGEDLEEGVERLRAAFADVGDQPLDDLCDALLSQLGEDAEDDVALVAVRFHER